MAYCTQQSVLEEAGLWHREVGETPDGAANGSNTVFTVKQKPLTDNDYSDTITVADVVLYVNGTPVTVNAVNATTGALTAAAAPSNGASVTADYSYSSVQLSQAAGVVEEAEDWINIELEEVVTTPFSTAPRRIRTIARIYAAGLLMIRYYALQNSNEEQEAAGMGKIKLAERMLAAYRARLEANGEDVGSTGMPVSTSRGRLFQQYDSTSGTWKPLVDENFTVNEAS